MNLVAANARSHSTITRIGRDQRPVLCIDEFSVDPARLVELASRADFIDAGPVYPGVRAPMPREYGDSLIAILDPLIRQVLAPPADSEPELELCALSLVCVPPERLRPIQRMPHFDGPEAERFAFLHYLCEPSQGGTSFYRHRGTGLEAVGPDDVRSYRKIVAQELASLDGGYAGAHTPCFEKIHTVEARFNRLIVYHGNALHSGDITDRTVLSDDPRRGRLTINGFGRFRSRR